MEFTWEIIGQGNMTVGENGVFNNISIRAKVFGGWIVRNVVVDMNGIVSESSVFVQDTIHQWVIDDNDNMRLEDLDLQIRTLNCLRAEGMKKVKDVLLFPESELKKIPNFGAVSLRNLKEELKKINRELRR